MLEPLGYCSGCLEDCPSNNRRWDVGKGPKNEDDPIGQRWFAKRIADMKWWGRNSKPEQPAEPKDQPEEPASEEPQAKGDDQQQPTDEEPSSEKD